MVAPNTDKVFAGAVPMFYETYLVPLIFQPYATDLARRVAAQPVRHVLEIAAGTGVVTRALDTVLPADATLVATDLNQPMLDQAASLGTRRAVQWQQADALALPFADATFDAVVCQFGVMFFPDKPRAFAQALRVLKPGGRLLFNAWDRIEENEFADVVTAALAKHFPQDPPRFLARTPHGYHDRAAIARDLAAGGFTASAAIETVAARSRATSSRLPALAYCHGTPLRNEIEARDPDGLDRATDIAHDAVAQRFGHGDVDGKVQAHVIEVARA